MLADRRVRQAIGYAIDREAIVRYLRRGLAQPAVGVVPPAVVGVRRRTRFSSRTIPARAQALLDEAGYRDPDGDGPAPRLRLTLKVSTNEFYRLQAAVIQQDLREVGIELDVRSYEFATLSKDVASRQLSARDAAVGRHLRSRHAAPRLPLEAGAAGRLQSRVLQQPGSRSADRRGDGGDRRRDARGGCTGEAQQRIAEDAPYISLWYKTNVAVAQPDLTGIRLTPLAEFTFLKDVSRQSGPTTSSASHRLDDVPHASVTLADPHRRSRAQPLIFSSSCRASCANGESACCSTI